MCRNRDIQWESEDDFLSFKFLCRPSVGGRGMQAGFARLSYLIFLPCPGKKNTLHQEITPNPFRESPDLWRAFCNYLSIVCGKNKNKKLNLQILCVLIYVHIKQITKQKVKILYSGKITAFSAPYVAPPSPPLRGGYFVFFLPSKWVNPYL